MKFQKYTDHYDFWNNVTDNIEGWLIDYTAIRTMDMLQWQVKNDIGGSLFEIGVFKGKYFSLLIQSGLESSSKVVGLDTFQYSNEANVNTLLEKYFPSGSWEFISKASTNCNTKELMDILGSPPRFISVDGSHECDDVFWDLNLAEEILSSEGIVAADDFLNPLTLGVNEAINRFFSTPRNLVPFAYIANKLFLCRPETADKMIEFIEEVATADQKEIRSQNFRSNLAKARHFVEQKMWGSKFIILP